MIRRMPDYSYVRIYADTNGESHFDDVTIELSDVDFAPPAPPAFVSGPQDAEKMMFFSAPAGWDGTWHPTPKRQFMAVLKGEFEVEVSDGETRVFAPGDLLLVEDISGKGHYTKIPESAEENLIIITQLPDND
ncbi:MAG: cupin domain-containing protein [Chloroflexi bacterium]|nr:cupin domain-containing protein [Chloroflexota bacterium]